MKIFKKMGRYLLLEGVFYVFMGICLIMAPMTTMNTIVALAAAVMAVHGVVNIVSSLKDREGSGFMSQFMILGILELVAALVLFIYKGKIAVVLPIALGVLIVISSCVSIFYALDLRKTPGAKWLWVLLYGLACVLVGVLIIVNPFKGLEMAVMACGIMMFVRAVGNFAMFFTGKAVKRELDR